jgi:signal-transduction protein with cAMP-binding, CBS, and nucleotidyltransferase domain
MPELDVPVAEVMTTPVRTVGPETSIREVSTIIATEGIGSVVVEEGRGIVTKTDVVTGLSDGIDAEKTPVGALMTSPLVVVEADATLGRAIERMAENGIKRVVVERDGGVVGAVTTTDVITQLSPDLDSIVEMLVG